MKTCLVFLDPEPQCEQAVQKLVESNIFPHVAAVSDTRGRHSLHQKAHAFFRKYNMSGCTKELLQWLNAIEIQRVYLTGGKTESSVLKTSMDLHEHNFNVSLIVDGITTPESTAFLDTVLPMWCEEIIPAAVCQSRKEQREYVRQLCLALNDNNPWACTEVFQIMRACNVDVDAVLSKPICRCIINNDGIEQETFFVDRDETLAHTHKMARQHMEKTPDLYMNLSRAWKTNKSGVLRKLRSTLEEYGMLQLGNVTLLCEDLPLNAVICKENLETMQCLM